MKKVHLFILSIAIICTNFLVCFQLINRFETEDCIISIVTNQDEEKFILKQIRDQNPDEQFLLVLDAVACQIAHEKNIPINQVKIVSAYQDMPEKYFTALPMTIHTFVPGVPLNNKNSYDWIDIHQRFRKKNSIKWKQWGPLPAESTGLTQKIIAHMATHSDLAKIAALDTFVGNADRSSPNLLYDQENDIFCGIDMAASFITLLGIEACKTIKKLLNKNIILSEKEKNGLVIYLHTLKSLIQAYPPYRIIRLLHYQAKQAGFIEGSYLLNQDVQNRIKFHERIIRENYHDCQKLIHLIEEYLKINS